MKGKVNKMTEMNTNEFNNTIGEIRKLCKTIEQFSNATYGLCAAHSRALAKKYGYDDATVSWGFENTFDNMNVIFKHYTNMDTLTCVILETV